MKRFRIFLSTLLAVAFCSIIIVTPMVNAATTVALIGTTVQPDTTMTWYSTGEYDGKVLTNGGTQVLYFSLGESGNKINMGFRRTANLSRYSWYSGTLSGKTRRSSKILTGPTGYYRPYLTNNN